MLVYRVKKEKMLDFVNNYEPLWYAVCEEYDFGNNSTGLITERQLNTLDLEVKMSCDIDETTQQLGLFYIEAIAHADNDCIVLEDWDEQCEVTAITNWLDYLELCNEVNEE